MKFYKNKYADEILATLRKNYKIHNDNNRLYFVLNSLTDGKTIEIIYDETPPLYSYSLNDWLLGSYSDICFHSILEGGFDELDDKEIDNILHCPEDFIDIENDLINELDKE